MFTNCKLKLEYVMTRQIIYVKQPREAKAIILALSNEFTSRKRLTKEWNIGLQYADGVKVPKHAVCRDGLLEQYHPIFT